MILPTGSGKTAVGLWVVESLLAVAPERLGLLVAPTRPLIAQQLRACSRIVGLDAGEDAQLLTGEIELPLPSATGAFLSVQTAPYLPPSRASCCASTPPGGVAAESTPPRAPGAPRKLTGRFLARSSRVTWRTLGRTLQKASLGSAIWRTWRRG